LISSSSEKEIEVSVQLIDLSSNSSSTILEEQILLLNDEAVFEFSPISARTNSKTVLIEVIENIFNLKSFLSLTFSFVIYSLTIGISKVMIYNPDGFVESNSRFSAKLKNFSFCLLGNIFYRVPKLSENLPNLLHF
jgi:hypothetical protein